MYMYQLINIELYLKNIFFGNDLLSYAQWYIWQFPYVHNKDKALGIYQCVRQLAGHAWYFLLYPFTMELLSLVCMKCW